MKMNYFVLGTNDMQAATSFYDALFEGEDLAKIPANDRMTYWMGKDFAFALAVPFDKQPATNGNGTMIGFAFNGSDDVVRLHQKAIDLGATCEGKPGQRGPKYSAYIRDLDGNKICLSD